MNFSEFFLTPHMKIVDLSLFISDNTICLNLLIVFKVVSDVHIFFDFSIGTE